MIKKQSKRRVRAIIMTLTNSIWYLVLLGIPIIAVGRALGIFYDLPPFVYGLVVLIFIAIFILSFFVEPGDPEDF